MRIAVAGGTGVVGRWTVAAARAAGHEPVVLARSTGVDLTTGDGLTDALDGVDAVIDTTNVTTQSRAKAIEFFERTSRNLIAAAATTGVRHVVALSIVGIDRVPLGYYGGKLRQEEVLRESSVPVSVLRATQFHEFAGQLLERLPGGPVVLFPAMKSQPIAASEVGEVLVDLAAGDAVAMTELAGPKVELVADMARRLLRARGSRKPVLQVRMPGKAMAAAARGGMLPVGDYRRGVQTFDEWLAAGPVDAPDA